MPVGFSSRIFSGMESIADELRPGEETVIRSFSGMIYTSQEIGSPEEDTTKFKIEYFRDSEESGNARGFVVLGGSDRRKALQAIADHKLVSFDGVLSEYGRSKFIEEPANFRVI